MAYACVGLSLLLGGAVGGVSYRIHLQNGRESSTGLPLHPRPDETSRLLVLAPHCDDETLGCGGLLTEAVRAGSAVRIVLITNGDGFHLGVMRSGPRVRVGPDDFKEFAARRQNEVHAAVASLGVSPRDVLFLGYPDRGIAHMWLYHWREESAYTSPYTRVAASPYPDSYRPNAPYCGDALLQDLERIIREFRPTAVYLPHPNDDHPDHWATANFGQAALEHLGLTDRVAAYTYLVHRGDWPVPQGFHPSRCLAPPAALARLDTDWTAFPLSDEAAAAKEGALGEYRSQMALMRRFLSSFLRSTELFGVLPPAYVPQVEPGTVGVDGDGGEWAAVPTAIQEPAKDRVRVELQGGADLVAVRACQDGERIHFLLSTRHQASSRLQYTLFLRTLADQERTVTLSVGPGARSSDPAVQMVRRGRFIEASVPLSRLGGARSVLVGAVARTRRFTIDRTGWRLLRLEAPGSLDQARLPAGSQVQP